MSKRILLADDSLTIQKVVELTFMDEDFEVVAVGSGDEAISRLDAELPNIVIADVHMPGASGYEVCRRAKAMSADLPVLLLVGTFEVLDENEMAACGADGNLKKPFDSQELLQVVRRMTQGRGPKRIEPSASQPIEGFETTSHEDEFEAASAELPVTGFDLGGRRPEEASAVTKPKSALADFEAHLADLEAEPELAPVDLDVDLEADTGWRQVEPGDESDMYGAGNETVLIDLDAAPQPADESPLADVFGADSEAEASTEAVAEEPEEAPASASSAAGGLSDADIERVAHRVVELMSADAVREVAWDVIPDMAEIVIKARVRELEAEAD